MKPQPSLSLWRILAWCFLSVCLLPLLPVLFVVLPAWFWWASRQAKALPADLYEEAADTKHFREAFQVPAH